MKTKTTFKKGHKPTYTKTGKEHSRYKHGMFGTPIYKKWMAMKRRCLNKNDTAYARYGGRGITICAAWLDFQGFYNDMGKSFKVGLSLERINNNKGYMPENCKWIPLSQQNKNKRNIPLYEWNGEKMTTGDWEKRLGLKQGAVYMRIIKYRWPLSKALTKRI